MNSPTFPGSLPRLAPSGVSPVKSDSGRIDIASTGHSAAHIPQPLQKNSFIPQTRPDSSVNIDESGHCTQHFRQDTHFAESITGRMLRQRPVSTA
jgi:hypothetical protein